ncbi:hypothetical protein PUNSTDRAFT_135878 [Punctularia strigosozonata HHB-11173 SS5]|uniref:uncharacterized protein n=1 Tax=Punctularia strigosozonata (strain HHB-11173) TaxID=741275 RepID=UPI000441655E|nr:uncharacterized protein PUNSTDRAFT_135878 [Punctularia strigosozonata HHB-11173 SS5]EIN07195.1 hypothetical protein PUNSTDRAFT_135878 [Punctularia strigosozonata HHB-11173 SS5]
MFLVNQMFFLVTQLLSLTCLIHLSLLHQMNRHHNPILLPLNNLQSLLHNRVTVLVVMFLLILVQVLLEIDHVESVLVRTPIGNKEILMEMNLLHEPMRV